MPPSTTPFLTMIPSTTPPSHHAAFSLCTLLTMPTRTTPPSRYAPFSLCPFVQHPLLAMHPSHYAHSYNTPFSLCTLLTKPIRTTPPSHRTFFILLHPLLVTPPPTTLPRPYTRRFSLYLSIYSTHPPPSYRFHRCPSWCRSHSGGDSVAVDI